MPIIRSPACVAVWTRSCTRVIAKKSKRAYANLPCSFTSQPLATMSCNQFIAEAARTIEMTKKKALAWRQRARALTLTAARSPFPAAAPSESNFFLPTTGPDRRPETQIANATPYVGASHRRVKSGSTSHRGERDAQQRAPKAHFFWALSDTYWGGPARVSRLSQTK